jgi:glutamate-1-semialdehyde 2,1-aminomutase
MLERGIYLPPAQFETAFVSAAHSASDVETLRSAFQEVLGTASDSGTGPKPA